MYRNIKAYRFIVTVTVRPACELDGRLDFTLGTATSELFTSHCEW